MNPNPRAWDGNSEAREALQSAVDNYGPAVLSNAQMLSNLFKDLLPDSPREASALVTAAEAGVAGMLTQAAQHMDPDSAIRMTGAALAERRAIDATAGAWAAAEFARALGYVTTEAPEAQVAGDGGESHSDAATEVVSPVPVTPPPPAGQPPSSSLPATTSPLTPAGKNRRRVLMGIIAVALLAGGIGAAVALSGNGTHRDVKTSLSSTGSGSQRTTGASQSTASATTSPASATTSPVTTTPTSSAPVASPPVASATPDTTPATVAAASQAIAAPATAAPVTAPPPPPAVPAVVGLSLNVAADQLKAAGYSNIPYVYSCLGSQNHGLVVSQTPAGGTAAALATAVDLRLEGINCRTVPGVVNLDLTSAANLLKSAGFSNIPYVYQCLGSGAKGAVVTQSPGPGADIVATNPVQLKLQANNC